MRKSNEDDFLQNSCCVLDSDCASCLCFDHVACHAFLKHAINWCKNVSGIDMNSMKHCIVHSDDCGQKLFQIFPDTTTNDFIISHLPCSCPSCRETPTNVDNCMCKEHRNIARRSVRISNDTDDDEEGDNTTNLTVKELKDMCWLCGLPVSGRKELLAARIVTHF